jgi:hypothetical protein
MKFRLRKPVKWLAVLMLVPSLLGVSGGNGGQNAQAWPVQGLSFFGMNLYVTGLERPKNERYAIMDDAADIGVQWTREEMSWANIEIRQGVFDWIQYDFWVNELVKRNLKIVGVLETTPSWASGVRSNEPDWYWYAPKDPVEYGNYAYEMALRYKGKIDVWELWNEPDVEITFKCACDRVQRYADMLREGYNAIKRANPDAKVLIGGLSIHDTYDGGMQFLDQVVAASGGQLNFDVLSIHPYMPDRYPENTDPKTVVQNFPYRLEMSYQWLQAHGAGNMEIWITEDGYSTCSTCGNLGVSEEEQARRLIRLYVIAMGAKNVTHFSYFQMKDKFNAGPGDLFGNMGILRNDMSQKPAYEAYKVLTDQLTGASFTGLGSLARGVENRWQSQFDRYHYKFSKEGATVQVLWKIGESEEVDVPVDSPTVAVVMKDGSQTSPSVSDGKVHITISEDPVFIDEIQPEKGITGLPLDPAKDSTSPTGLKASSRFADYWQTQGGLPLFGYAISPERLEKSPTDGKTYIVQWFERARFEYHPENAGTPNEVLLGLLGNQTVEGRAFPSISPPADVQSVCVKETGHCVWGKFLERWNELGVPVVGLPISDQYEEQSTDGKTYTVQWFERARFEYHPENQAPYDVLLGLLGKQLYKP